MEWMDACLCAILEVSSRSRSALNLKSVEILPTNLFTQYRDDNEDEWWGCGEGDGGVLCTNKNGWVVEHKNVYLM